MKESVIIINDREEVIMVRNDIKSRSRKIYKCVELSLEEIGELLAKLPVEQKQ